MLHFEWIMNIFPVQIESDFSNHQHSAKAWDEFFCTFGLQFNSCFVSFWKFRNWLLMHVLEKSREVWLPRTIQAEAAHIFIRIKYANPKNFNLGLFRFWVSSNARFSSWHSRVIDGPKTYSFYDSFQWIKPLYITGRTSAVLQKQCFKRILISLKSSLKGENCPFSQPCTAFLFKLFRSRRKR